MLKKCVHLQTTLALLATFLLLSPSARCDEVKLDLDVLAIWALSGEFQKVVRNGIEMRMDAARGYFKNEIARVDSIFAEVESPKLFSQFSLSLGHQRFAFVV